MFRFLYLFLTIHSLLISSGLIAQITEDDYKVYAALIKTEILETTPSIAIIEGSIGNRELHKNVSMITELLSSNILSNKYQVYSWTENSKSERPSVIDSTTSNFLIAFCNSKIENFSLSNKFNQEYKIILIKKIPIKQPTMLQDWKRFYDIYPGSGGIFSFSKITYFKASNPTAIFYYWHRRNGLNGHGALAMMTKIENAWQIKYKTYIWWN